MLGAATAACATGCASPSDVVRRRSGPDVGAGRLGFRPGGDVTSPGPPGRNDLQGEPDAPPAQVYAPKVGAHGLTLVLCLHGAGSPAGRALDRMLPYADERSLLLLAPKSVGTSWDAAQGGLGPDVVNIDRLLSEVTSRYPVSRYVVNGFSDGASYALSLGVANGRLFDSVVAWSPGFMVGEAGPGRPRVFVSHGVDDEVLPIGATSRRLVPQLREAGYDVTYEEFPGGHVVPPEVRRRSVRWLVRGS